MSGFQFLEPVHQPVELSVGNLRVVQHVIAVFVVTNLLAKLLDFVLRSGGFGHEILGRTEKVKPARII